MTAEIAGALGADVIRHKENMGYGAALRTILHKAREENADILAILDADGQHDPRAIPLLMKPILENKADIVIGSRFLGGTDAKKYRTVGVKLITKATNILAGTNITDAQSGFRVYNKRAIQLIRPIDDGMGASVEILIQAKDAGLRIKEEPITIKYEGLDTSTEHPVKHGMGVINALISKTIARKPLRYLGIPGVLFVGVGIFFVMWLVSLFNQTRYFSLPMAITAVGFIAVGVLLILTGIQIYIIRNLEKKLVLLDKKE